MSPPPMAKMTPPTSATTRAPPAGGLGARGVQVAGGAWAPGSTAKTARIRRRAARGAIRLLIGHPCWAGPYLGSVVRIRRSDSDYCPNLGRVLGCRWGRGGLHAQPFRRGVRGAEGDV